MHTVAYDHPKLYSSFMALDGLQYDSAQVSAVLSALYFWEGGLFFNIWFNLPNVMGCGLNNNLNIKSFIKF